MIRSLLCAALLGLILVGCVNARGEHYTYREAVTIDTTKLGLDGYYFREEITPYDSNKVIRPILLWQDGTAAYFMGTFGGSYIDEDGATHPFGTTYEGAHEAFQEYLADIDRGTGSEANWGAFRIQGDSISIQTMFGVYPSGFTFDVNEYNGIIQNDTTFILTETYAPRDDRRYSTREIYHFRPLENKPTSENWTQTHPKLQ